jgi:nucleotide-binding universal stress UspA family protein
MKKLLIPTDFSNCARNAEALGLELAQKSNAEIHFLHIVHTPIEWVGLPLEKENLYPETKAAIANAKSELAILSRKAEALGLSSKEHLVYNRGRQEIFEILKRYEIDLVIMGSNGAQGFKEMLGSNAQMMVRYSPVPVLVVKDTRPEIKNIVFASNFEAVPLSSATLVNQLAQILNAKIQLLFVNTPYDFRETHEVEADMRAFIKEAALENATPHIYNALNAERGIARFAEQNKTDLIVLASVSKSELVKLIASSLRENLVNHVNVPVLSISADE